MKFLESISLASFILGGMSLIIGSFFPYFFISGNYVNTFNVFEDGVGLLIFFWTIAIGIASYSKYTQ